MPKLTLDVIEAATRCFHLNAGSLVPEYIVIHSPHSGHFAVTTASSYQLRKSAFPTSDWRVAINLQPQDLMAIMGQLPTSQRRNLEPIAELPDSPQPETLDIPAEEPENACGA